MKEYLLKLIKEYPNMYSFLSKESTEKYRSKLLINFEKYGLSGICSEFNEWCENWPKVTEGFKCTDPNDHTYIYDEKDLDPEKEYYSIIEDLDIENFEGEIKIDEGGEEYIDVNAGGDWQNCHSFQIYKNPNNSEKPLICKNIIKLEE